jgi:uncharacterized protein YgbK (DUF1537 family)
MPAVLVIADDLTGANATGAMFARLGLRTRTAGALAAGGPGRDEVDVLVLVTGSRHLPPSRAATRIRELLSGLGPADEPELLVKRVDTTLRGPLAAELAAVLEHRRDRGRRVVGLAVPAFPSAGRTTVGGIHLLYGVPLAQGAAAHDPLAPVHHSRVATLLTAGTGLRAREVHLDELAHAEPSDVLAEALSGPDTDVVVVDAVSEADLTHVARAAATARDRMGDVDVVAVDSGPFGAAYCNALGIAATRVTRHPVLLVVGSLAERTHEQLAVAEATLGGQVIEVDIDLSAGALAERAVDAIDAGAPIVGWRTAVPAGRPDPDAAASVPGWLAIATRQVLGARRVGGVLASGGDVATAVLEAVDAYGVDVEAEVQPLVVAGRISGGPWEGLPVITKGGLVGDERAVLDSIARLQSMQAEQGRGAVQAPADPSEDRKVARS